jgi:hypothetical protein
MDIAQISAVQAARRMNANSMFSSILHRRGLHGTGNQERALLRGMDHTRRDRFCPGRVDGRTQKHTVQDCWHSPYPGTKFLENRENNREFFPNVADYDLPFIELIKHLTIKL